MEMEPAALRTRLSAMPIYSLLTAIVTLTFVGSPFVVDPFSGFDASQTPVPQDNPPIQPAGYAFAIWGVIYTWLVVSAGFGLWRRSRSEEWNAVRPALIVSLFVGTFWLWIANQSVIWATVTIWIMLVAAVIALLRAPLKDRWLLRAPLALYAGWLSAASFVSLSAMLAGYGILFDPKTWALVLIPIAALFAVGIQISAPVAPEYGLAVGWAFIAVMVANWGGPWSVAILAGKSTMIIGVFAAFSIRRVMPRRDMAPI